jgi:hypothetical protein
MSYLILGDGDFTYSLDLCRYFSLVSKKTEGLTSISSQLTIVCTGIDTLEELREKYKDIDFILGEIRSQSRDNTVYYTDVAPNGIGDVQLIHTGTAGSFKTARKEVNPDLKTKVEIQTNEVSTTPVNKSHSLHISIHHGVNAIQPWDGPSQDIYNSDKLTCLHPKPPLPQRIFDNIIFNHPHIGTEDAALHSLFLCHLFNTCIQSWLSTRGVLHLTLVKGQCERWKCITSANSCGLHLIHRVPFAFPLEANNSRYRHRRHQSGKSFASRAKCGSETLVFGLVSHCKEGRGCLVDPVPNAMCLPWQRDSSFKENEKMDLSSNVKSFSCTSCDKSFHEERSLISHIKAVHSNSSQDDVPGKKNAQKQLTCPHCPLLPNIKPRSFANTAALEAHKVAKHSGIHTNVLPDWCKRKRINEIDESSKMETVIEKCSVCHVPFLNEEERLNHYLDFIPTMTCFETKVLSSDLLSDSQNKFACIFCDKRFRERRAKMQHENFCSKKVT